MRKSLRLLALAAPLLSGCTVGPDFTPPKADMPAGWTKDGLQPVAKNQQPSSASTAPIQTQWWASFDDPTLISLIDRASTANLNLRQAVLRIAEAREEGNVASAALFPTLSGNAGYTRERISEKTAFTSLLGSIGGAHASPGGGAPPGRRQQRDFLAAQPLRSISMGLRCVVGGRSLAWCAGGWLKWRTRPPQRRSRTGTTCWCRCKATPHAIQIALRAAQLRRSVLQDDLTSQREILDITRDRAKVGIGNDIDVANASAEVTSTEAQLPPATAEITQDINQLSLLLGLQPGALRAELDTAKPVPPVPPEVPVGLPADLARRRPDIRRAEAQLHAATAQIGSRRPSSSRA